MIRIIIVDDHPMVRRGLRDAVATESDITVVAETGVPDEVLPAIRAHPCDVLLLDMALPGRGGIFHTSWATCCAGPVLPMCSGTGPARIS